MCKFIERLIDCPGVRLLLTVIVQHDRTVIQDLLLFRMCHQVFIGISEDQVLIQRFFIFIEGDRAVIVHLL